MSTLFIVPARTGSARLPNKNFTPLVGLSPLQRAIRCVRTVIASTDDQLVVTGDWIPRDEVKENITYHRRPAELATDTASMIYVVLNVLAAFHGPPDQSVILVQPTQPLRRPEHLAQACQLLLRYPSVASVAETVTCDKLYRRENEMLVPILGGSVERDQNGTPTYRCDGTAYGFRRRWFLDHQTFRDPHHTFTFIIPPDETCPLDTPFDRLVASLLLEHAQR